MITKDYVDEFGRDISIDVYYAEDGTDAVLASVTKDGGRLGEFMLAQGRVWACANWDELNQRYREMHIVNPYDPVVGILIGSRDAAIYLERFSEKLGKYRGGATYGLRPSRRSR